MFYDEWVYAKSLTEQEDLGVKRMNVNSSRQRMW